jgi:phage gpG-like protein
MAVHLEIHSEEVQQAMRHLSARIADLKWLWPDIAGEFYKREMALFAAEGEGAWESLSPNYAAWKSKYYPGLPLLSLRGDLKSSLVARLSTYAIYEDEPQALTLGSSVPYALAHQYGYKPRNLPARPPIIIDDPTERSMEGVAEREFANFCETLGFGVTRQ